LNHHRQSNDLLLNLIVQDLVSAIFGCFVEIPAINPHARRR